MSDRDITTWFHQEDQAAQARVDEQQGEQADLMSEMIRRQNGQ